MKKTVDVGQFVGKMRKIIKEAQLPEGFLYFTDTHIVEGTGKFIGTKKEERTAATVVPQEV
jgi:hypothetical protein